VGAQPRKRRERQPWQVAQPPQLGEEHAPAQARAPLPPISPVAQRRATCVSPQLGAQHQRATTPARASGALFRARPDSRQSTAAQALQPSLPESIEWLAKPRGPAWRRQHLAKWQRQRGYSEDIALCNAYLPLKWGRRKPGFTADGRATSWARANAVESGTSMFKPGTAGNPPGNYA